MILVAERRAWGRKVSCYWLVILAKTPVNFDVLFGVDAPQWQMLQTKATTKSGAGSVLGLYSASQFAEIAYGHEVTVVVALKEQKINHALILAAILGDGQGEEYWRLIGALTILLHTVNVHAQPVVSPLEGSYVPQSQRKCQSRYVVVRAEASVVVSALRVVGFGMQRGAAGV